MSKDSIYYLGFSYFLGIGPARFQALINHFQTAKNAYLAKEKELEQIIGKNLTERFVTFRNQFDLKKELARIEKKKIQIICLDDRLYPKNLANIADPPICLFVKGDTSLFQKLNEDKLIFFAIVGTRKPTSYGQDLAAKFATDLAASGLVIVSGMAMGIDTIAHQSALAQNQPTVAVLGCGVDVIYPQINERLYHQIIEKGGLVISEFPPEQTVKKGLFVARNRIISGLSKGVLVIEGTKTSGALITAKYAAEQGKDVFAPPAPLTSTLSEAPLLLLKQGAKLVTQATDILEEFNLRLLPKTQAEIDQLLTDEEKEVFQALIKEEKSADDLVLELKKEPATIFHILSALEIKGVIKKDDHAKYRINNFSCEAGSRSA
jgi:DNA processing protein